MLVQLTIYIRRKYWRRYKTSKRMKWKMKMKYIRMKISHLMLFLDSTIEKSIEIIQSKVTEKNETKCTEPQLK